MSTAAPKKKRVLFIINQFFRGGAETALVNLLRTMDSARFDVDLLIFDMIDLPGSLSLIPEIPDWVRVINVAENEKKTAFVKKAVFKLERKLTGTQPFRRGRHPLSAKPILRRRHFLRRVVFERALRALCRGTAQICLDPRRHGQGRLSPPGHPAL